MCLNTTEKTRLPLKLFFHVTLNKKKKTQHSKITQLKHAVHFKNKQTNKQKDMAKCKVCVLQQRPWWAGDLPSVFPYMFLPSGDP